MSRYNRTLIRLTLAVSTITACSDSQGVSFGDPTDASSADFALEPVGGHNGYVPGQMVWQDSATFQVRLDGDPVAGAVVHYRVTMGDLRPLVDTSDSDGGTFYVWRASTTQSFDGELFACVEGKDGCVEKRLVGFRFTPEQ